MKRSLEIDIAQAVHDALIEEIEEETKRHEVALNSELARYQRALTLEASIFAQRMQNENDNHKKAMQKLASRKMGLQHQNTFEIECLGGRASCLCEISKATKDSVFWERRIASTKFGLTVEHFNILENPFSENRISMLRPSSSRPSVRKNYKGFDKIQVACLNGLLWLNAVVMTSVAGNSHITVHMETVESSNRPVRVRRTSVRMRDWFVLHERCRKVVYWLLLSFEQLGLVRDVALLIAKIVWSTRDDQEWLEEFE